MLYLPNMLSSFIERLFQDTTVFDFHFWCSVSASEVAVKVPAQCFWEKYRYCLSYEASCIGCLRVNLIMTLKDH